MIWKRITCSYKLAEFGSRDSCHSVRRQIRKQFWCNYQRAKFKIIISLYVKGKVSFPFNISSEVFTFKKQSSNNAIYVFLTVYNPKEKKHNLPIHI